MGTQTEIGRRDFLKAGVTSGAALVLGFYMPPRRGQAQVPPSARDELFKPNAWIRITTDNQITVLVEMPEMGQGPRTADTMILAEELEAD
jgi:isoquinoline 1-oxidoreductase subunit beta